MPRNVSVLKLCCLTPFLFASPLAAQSAWTKAPPLPRACYRLQDTFESDVEKVRTELEAAIERQKEINRGLGEQLMNMDPATLNQRMMAAMQRDPAKAQEIMQAMQSLGTEQAQDSVLAAEAEEGDFKARKAKLEADYRAEWEAVLRPSHQRIFDENSSNEDRAAGLTEYNRQYETVLCPRWFGKQVPDLVASYRAYLVEQRIPGRAEAEAAPLAMFEMFGVSTKDFRPIAELQAVVDYLRFASDLFLLRFLERRRT